MGLPVRPVILWLGVADGLENYLTRARLPWAQATPQTPRPTFPADQLQSSEEASGSTAAVGGRSNVDSGTSTPASAGFVSLESLKDRLHRHKRKNGQKAAEGDEEAASSRDDEDADPLPDFLRFDPNGLDPHRYAVLFNDWPYNVPYGVRHYCVWSRVCTSLIPMFRLASSLTT
jgi:hypothetical protein